MSQFLQLVVDDAEVPYRFGLSTVWVRVLDNPEIEALRKRFTKTERVLNKKTHAFEKEDTFDHTGYTDAVMIEAITRWDHVYRYGTSEQLACEPSTKVRLPNHAKLAVLQIAVGRDADVGDENGQPVERPEETAKNVSAPISTGR